MISAFLGMKFLEPMPLQMETAKASIDRATARKSIEIISINKIYTISHKNKKK